MKKFFTFTRRIDPEIKYAISVKGVKNIPLILQLKHYIDNPTKRRLSRMGFKIKYEVNFLECICGSLPVRNFDSLKALVEIKKIFYDDKAEIMGRIIPQLESVNSGIAVQSRLLNGRAVSMAFIDTGVKPLPAFTKPRRRILAFKDFITDKKDPFDDSGHGTAAIAAASVPAAEAGIVCARAFDISGHGFYSDIIASMDWILELKEKHNIRIAVLNFGAKVKDDAFDILAAAAEALWKSGLLVVACAGNLGPEAATITSPGHSAKLLTIGAMDTGGEKPSVSSWSSRGPASGNIDKPDLVMPGCIPSENLIGTSASASMVAGVAAMLYEKKPQLSPDDAKSLLKVCCASFGALKQSQGKGYIKLEKIEEL